MKCITKTALWFGVTMEKVRLFGGKIFSRSTDEVRRSVRVQGEGVGERKIGREDEENKEGG